MSGQMATVLDFAARRVNAREEPPEVEFLKMDVDGYKIDVIEGATEAFSRTRYEEFRRVLVRAGEQSRSHEDPRNSARLRRTPEVPLGFFIQRRRNLQYSPKLIESCLRTDTICSFPKTHVCLRSLVAPVICCLVFTQKTRSGLICPQSR